MPFPRLLFPRYLIRQRFVLIRPSKSLHRPGPDREAPIHGKHSEYILSPEATRFSGCIGGNAETTHPT